MKIFPWNLTARTDYVVRGNPPSTRPESGVDNCYPGLEFDQRNLDKAFFGGLTFEFHRPDGARLVAIAPGSRPIQSGLRPADVPLYLWALLPPPTPDETDVDPPVSFFHDLGGLDVWRQVHDLDPGPIAILLRRRPPVGVPLSDPTLVARIQTARDSGRSTVRRDGAGRLVEAVLAGQRARYLDDEGVIDIERYEPGELTRSLCAPWQYDFRDCGCFYWAASKPDVVTSADGQHLYLNFQRRDRTSVPPPADVGVNSAERRARELDYPELIGGAWNDVLPVVLDDRESEQFVPSSEPALELMSRAQVIEELRYLATVEHALSVEYLYAHDSLNAPVVLVAGASAQTRRIFAAATEVFNIAVDEMRHLRWAKEALGLLGEPPSLGRAERIGRQLDRPFALEPLTPEQLQWFVDVERPSQDLTGVLDADVRLHISVDRQPELFPERERLVHLIKLIIDEGQDHFVRFTSVQRHLAGLSRETYLRPLGNPPDQASAGLQDLADQNYAVLLGALQTSFSLGDRAGGILLEQARQTMFMLHDTNHRLAGRGARPRFRLPPTPRTVPAPGAPVRLDADAAHALVDSLSMSTRATTSAVAEAASDEPEQEELARRQLAARERLFGLMHQLIDEDLATSAAASASSPLSSSPSLTDPSAPEPSEP